jgi:hypothetical protein
MATRKPQQTVVEYVGLLQEKGLIPSVRRSLTGPVGCPQGLTRQVCQKRQSPFGGDWPNQLLIEGEDHQSEVQTHITCKEVHDLGLLSETRRCS